MKKTEQRWMRESNGYVAEREFTPNPMTIKEFKQWWNRFEYSGNYPEPKTEHINFLLAEITRLTAECQKWQEYHDAEYRERKKYRQDANYFAGEVDRLTSELKELEEEVERLKGEIEGDRVVYAMLEESLCAANQQLRVEGKRSQDMANLAASRLADQEYKKVIDDALVVANIGAATGDAKADVHKLICWEIDVALDPRVSKRAADLIRLADHGAVERHTRKVVAGEICEYLCKEWPFMGAGAVMDIKERYGVE